MSAKRNSHGGAHSAGSGGKKSREKFSRPEPLWEEPEEESDWEESAEESVWEEPGSEPVWEEPAEEPVWEESEEEPIWETSEEEPDWGYTEEEETEGEESSPEKEKKRRRRALLRTVPFFLLFAALTAFAWALPLRPGYSELERRELAAFPAFSVRSLFSGDWFEGISLWFSDTFPGRESWVEANAAFQSFYGLQGVTISGGMVTSDVVEENKTMEDVAAATPAPLPAASQRTPAPETTPEPTPTPDPADGVEFDSADIMRLNATIFFGDTGYELYGLGKGNAEYYGKVLGAAATKYAGEGRRMFSIICPNSGGIMLSLDTYDQLYDIRQDTAIDYFYSTAGEDLIPVLLYDTLRSHNQEYIYYRTDHHWTALGAWYAYEKFCQTAGFEAVTLDQFTMEEFPGFLGSFYKSANGAVQAQMKENPDTVYAFCPPGSYSVRSQNGGGWQEIELITDVSANNADSKYLAFLRGGEQYQIIIENQDIEDDSSCLLIKDSYGNPFALYLAQHYHTVVVMNFRNEFRVRRVLQEYDIDDIIVLTELVLAQQNSALGRFNSDFLY